jgi:hypothetical protein
VDATRRFLGVWTPRGLQTSRGLTRDEMLALVHAEEVVQNRVFGTQTNQDTVRNLLIAHFVTQYPMVGDLERAAHLFVLEGLSVLILPRGNPLERRMVTLWA